MFHWGEKKGWVGSDPGPCPDYTGNCNFVVICLEGLEHNGFTNCTDL